MSIWIQHSEDVRLPEYIKNNLPSICRVCRHPMENYYNDDGRCTFRRCSNPRCIGMIASRGAFMFKALNYSGIGYGTCRDWLHSIEFKSHVELLKFAGSVPTMPIYQYLRIHCFEGIDGEWEKICVTNGIYTLDELFEKYTGKFRYLLDQNKELLYDNLQYVKLVERPKSQSNKGPVKYYTVMVTGTPNGFDSKDDFFNKLNAILNGEIVLIHQKTKKMGGVDFLIREPGSTTRGKLDAAIRGGIPIKTSTEFIEFLAEEVEKMKAENK